MPVPILSLLVVQLGFEFAFSVPVSLVSLTWSSPDLVSNTPGYLLCFSNADIQLNTAVAVSVTAAHPFPLSTSVWYLRPLNPRFHLPHTQRLSAGLVFFFSISDYLSGKIVHLGWKILMPPTCDFNLSKSTMFVFPSY